MIQSPEYKTCKENAQADANTTNQIQYLTWNGFEWYQSDVLVFEDLMTIYVYPEVTQKFNFPDE